MKKMNMDNTVKMYEGAIFEKSTTGSYSIIGQDTCVLDSCLGKRVQLNRRNIISESIISDYTYTGANTIIKVAEIGKFCSISWNVSITGNIHDYSATTGHPFVFLPSFGLVEEKTSLLKKPIVIGNDVWIGANSCILGGVHISDGAVIGGGAVVTKDIPPYAIAVGNPATVIGYRFSEEIITRLLALKWWDWPEDVIRANVDLFKGKMTINKLDTFEQIAKKQLDEVSFSE